MRDNNYLSDPDVILMLKFKEGSAAAFEEIIDKYQKRVINVIYRLVPDKHEADDLAQEVFLRVYNYAKSYVPKAKLSTWIYTITRNICLNEIRRRRRTPVSLDQTQATDEGELKKELAVSEAKSPIEAISQQELEKIVKEAIGSLPFNQRMAVVLRRYEELSYEDIASSLNCSVSAVKALLNRSKEALKEKLRSYIIEA